MLAPNETRNKIERRALEITALIELSDGKFYAEIVPDCLPQWHLLETFANQELKAVDFLVERHFGVFLPSFDATASLLLDGVELCGGRRLIFPGHIFVFVWDILHHWRRVRACPGVRNVLMDRPEHPVVVSGKAIDFIQALQFGLSPNPLPKRKGRKAKYQQAQIPGKGEDTVTLWHQSHWNDINGLDGDGRNQLLHKALGLATKHGP